MNEPLISCLMVTQHRRLAFFKQAVQDFLAQTWPHKELVITSSCQPSAMQPYWDFVHSLDSPCIRLAALKPRQDGHQHVLGRMRNHLNDQARGEFCCTWDDDDRHHPRRLQTHYAAAQRDHADGSYLNEQLHYFPNEQRLFWVSWGHRRCPGILLYRRSSVRYPEEGKRACRGEDTSFISALVSSGQKLTSVSGGGEYYLRCYHGANTWHYGHHAGLAKRQAITREKTLARQQLIVDSLRQFEVGGPITVRAKNNTVAFVYTG